MVFDRKEYMRQWKLKNPDRILAAKKRFALNNKASIKESNRKHRAANLEKCRARERQYRLDNLSKRREGNRAYRLRNLERMRKSYREYSKGYWKKYREKYPEKYKAHFLVGNAIQSGRLVRQNCHCGERGQAHHPDYDKPLQVEWLCSTHHAELHRKYK